jgi:hypothetical protein
VVLTAIYCQNYARKIFCNILGANNVSHTKNEPPYQNLDYGIHPNIGQDWHNYNLYT